METRRWCRYDQGRNRDLHKDWGPKSAQPIVFHHGWPLSADDWDNQMLFFVEKGYRVVAHDRRGHGRSSQVSDGHDMDHYAADASAVYEHLDLKNTVHIGHSTGGGEVARYVAKFGQPQGRVAKARAGQRGAADHGQVGRRIPAARPSRCSTASARRSPPTAPSSISTSPAGPFYGFNRPGAKASPGVIQNWWRQGMIGSAKAHYDGIKAFSRPTRRKT